MVEMRSSENEHGEKRFEIRAGRHIDTALDGSVEGIGVFVVGKFPASGEITIGVAGCASFGSDADALEFAEAMGKAILFVTR